MRFKGQFNRDFKEYLTQTEFGQSLNTIHINAMLVFGWMPLEVQFAYVADFLNRVENITVYIDLDRKENLQKRWGVCIIHPVTGFYLVGMNFKKKSTAAKRGIQYCQKKYNLDKVSIQY